MKIKITVPYRNGAWIVLGCVLMMAILAPLTVTLIQAEQYGGAVVCRSAGRFGLTARIKAAGTDWDNSVPGFMCWPH